MLKILVPIDGLPDSLRAVEHVCSLYGNVSRCEIHLLNVQYPIVSGYARRFLHSAEIARIQRYEGELALAAACRYLEDAGVPYQHNITVGRIAETIGEYAKRRRFDFILMVARRRNWLMRILFGSTAGAVQRCSDVPVLLLTGRESVALPYLVDSSSGVPAKCPSARGRARARRCSRPAWRLRSTWRRAGGNS